MSNISLFLTKVGYHSISLLCDKHKYSIKQKEFKCLSTYLNIGQLILENIQIKFLTVLAIIISWVEIIYFFPSKWFDWGLGTREKHKK